MYVRCKLAKTNFWWTFSPLFRGEHPNTYVFTKGLAEQLILDKGQNLPLAIVRPSIVVASWKYPVKGWVDNLNGPTGCVSLIWRRNTHSSSKCPFWSVWCKMALAEVGMSLPWWYHALDLIASGYWRLFLNLIIFS